MTGPMTFYGENPRESTLKSINADKFSKVARYKNQLLSLYTYSEQSKNEIKTIPFMITSRKIKNTWDKFNKSIKLVH